MITNWTRKDKTNTELIKNIAANIEACIKMMNDAEEATRTAGALRALEIIRDNADVIPNDAKVKIANRLNEALELSPVKIDGTQPARKPLTTTQLVTRTWAMWASAVVIVLVILSAVIR